MSQSATDKKFTIASKVPATKATSDTGTKPESKKKGRFYFWFQVEKILSPTPATQQQRSASDAYSNRASDVPATIQKTNVSVVSLAEKTLYHSY